MDLFTARISIASADSLISLGNGKTVPVHRPRRYLIVESQTNKQLACPLSQFRFAAGHSHLWVGFPSPCVQSRCMFRCVMPISARERHLAWATTDRIFGHWRTAEDGQDRVRYVDHIFRSDVADRMKLSFTAPHRPCRRTSTPLVTPNSDVCPRPFC